MQDQLKDDFLLLAGLRLSLMPSPGSFSQLSNTFLNRSRGCVAGTGTVIFRALPPSCTGCSGAAGGLQGVLVPEALTWILI